MATSTSRELRLILTHEHTDFDALASLLGAALLYPDHTAVLPRRMNRNVSEFVALYRSYLPFVTPSELPKRRIGSIVLVDTRSLSAPRGIAPGCQITVIDHHVPPDEEASGVFALPKVDAPDPSFSISAEKVGANATLLVERLGQARTPLSNLHATLLALGIHEDTNSLTYGGATARDAAALAWLLEPAQGVNLDLLNRFLYHPLSEDQRRLLQELIAASEHVEVGGLHAVIASARLGSMAEEISTVAARLRDYHEPDALFVLVQMDDMVQVVARSTTSDVDVGAIMRTLGGGGHTRAAAASVHGKTGTQIAALIRAALAQQAHAVRTVASIMSHGRPQTLDPDMRIGEAAALMRRYGYEGFPVLGSAPGQGGAVPAGAGDASASDTSASDVPASDAPGSDAAASDAPASDAAMPVVLGVLTRREADRAMDHGLGNERVRRFMRTGSTSVLPTDSLNTLRQRMSESGWGQIPVVDAAGALVGIVTRTDLISTWDETPALRERQQEGARRLQAQLSPAQLALLQRIGVLVSELRFNIYVVGGFVRDLYLPAGARQPARDGGAVEVPTNEEDTASDAPITAFSQPSSPLGFDIDLVIEGNAIALAQRIAALYGGRVVPHKQFGTAKWLLDDPDYPLDLRALTRDLAVPVAAADLPSHLDFVTARTEFYTAPSALPTVESGSIKLDLVRRDFTINTLALCLTPARWGELLDYFGGLTDIREARVRVLHSLSFVDDPTRILRAVRYEQRFGFHIGTRTLELIRDALPLLDKVTPARIRHELERILQEAAPETALRRLDALGVLRALHPDLRADAEIDAAFQSVRDAWRQSQGTLAAALRSEPLERLYWATFVYWLRPATHAATLDALDEAVAERLRLRSDTQRLVQDVRRVQRQTGRLRAETLPPSAVVAALDGRAPAAIALVALLEQDATIARHAEAYLSQWQHVHPALDGNDLQRLGIARGPRYRAILWELRAARLDGTVTTRAEEEALASAFAAHERALPATDAPAA